MGRIGTEVKKNIAETQDMVLAALRTSQPPLPSVRNQVVEAVAQCGDVELANLGDAGKVIKRFANAVAPQHPEMSYILGQKDWDVFSRDVLQAIAVGNSEPGLRERLNNVYKPILRRFAVPKPRFVQSPMLRDVARREKKHVKHVGMKQVYMLGENSFYGKPSNFKLFVRNSTAHLEEISRLESQQQLFAGRGMPEVSHTVKKRIRGLEEMQEAACHGFHRLKPSDAAIIAAKMIGLGWNEMYFVIVPFQFFEHCYWYNVPDKREEDKPNDMKRLLVMRDRKMAIVDGIAFTYQPRLYPLAKFPELPSSVTEAVAAVESLPELGGCPAFDYYWVLVPSININHPYFRHKDGWKVRVREKDPFTCMATSLKVFQDEYEAALALDITLIADGYLPPVVLGERDGACYFVCMWR